MGRGEWQIKEPAWGRAGLDVKFDGVLIDEGGGEGTEKLGDPESVPHATGQTCGRESTQRDHDDDVAAQRDDEGLGALAQCFQRAGGRDREGGYQEARADNAQSNLTGGDGIGVVVNMPIKAGLPTRQMMVPAAIMAASYPWRGCKSFHAAMLSGTVIIADEGAHALHNAARGRYRKVCSL